MKLILTLFSVIIMFSMNSCFLGHSNSQNEVVYYDLGIPTISYNREMPIELGKVRANAVFGMPIFIRNDNYNLKNSSKYLWIEPPQKMVERWMKGYIGTSCNSANKWVLDIEIQQFEINENSNEAVLMASWEWKDYSQIQNGKFKVLKYNMGLFKEKIEKSTPEAMSRAVQKLADKALEDARSLQPSK